MPLLTIAIPTFNRSRHLRFLLSVLERELAGLEDDVCVLVSDNASTDDTPAVVAEFEGRLCNVRSRRNTVNAGPDANITCCYLIPDTPYVWVLGDDDAPLPGAMRMIVALLRRESPDMLYLPSLPTIDIHKDHAHHRLVYLDAVQLGREDFASVIHIQFTFISGIVLRKSTALTDAVGQALDVTQESNLIQLAWTFETLKLGHNFLLCRGWPLMATAANSGGYSAFQVFMVNHTRIASVLLREHPALLRRVLRKTSLCFLPGLVWHVRNGSFGNFRMLHRAELSLPDEISSTPGFRWLVRPIWSLPLALAKVAFFFSRVSTFTVRQYQRFVLFPRCKAVQVRS